jgi:hypothetical protein
MTINHSRLKLLLTPEGFVESIIESDSMTFVRTDRLEGLFQKIHVDCQGRMGEAVYGNVSTSVTKYIQLKIDERRHLMELDIDKDRNWTVIKTAEDAKRWELRFVEIAPVAAQRFTREHGDELLRRTSHARHRASKHLQRLNSSQSLYQQIQQFEATKGADFRKAAERLAESPGVMQLFDSEEAYLLACCAVLSGAENKTLVEQDPLHNEELMWQIQLIADGILRAQEQPKGGTWGSQRRHH